MNFTRFLIWLIVIAVIVGIVGGAVSAGTFGHFVGQAFNNVVEAVKSFWNTVTK